MNRHEYAEPSSQTPRSEQLVAPARAYPARKAAWWCFILAAAAWALHLFISYGLVEWHCRRLLFEHAALKTGLYVLTGALFLLALGCAVVCRRCIRRQARHPQAAEQGLFALRLAMLLSALFAATIFVQGFPLFLVTLCTG